MTAAKGSLGLRIYGESDDLVELEGVCDLVTKCQHCGHEFDQPSAGVVGKGSEEIGCYDSDVTIHVGFQGAGAFVGVIVDIGFGADGWESRFDNTSPWEIATGLSGSVHIDAPDGTPVRWEVSR